MAPHKPDARTQAVAGTAPAETAAGEVVTFDRIWYNRVAVERATGFCSEDLARRFPRVMPDAEKLIVESGIVLLKCGQEISQDGVVFQKDLGTRTDPLPATMRQRDPDLIWARVDDAARRQRLSPTRRVWKGPQPCSMKP